jgi:uncharacterized membrane protein (DUF4010 family)
MLDVITLQARGQYKQHEYLQQAAKERLLRQLRPRQVGPAVVSQLASMIVATAVLLLALALRPTAGPVEAAAAPAVVADTSSPTFAAVPAPDCWVSGDLVGDANPVEVSAALCGK